MIRPEPQAARLSHLCGLSIEDKVPDHSAFSHARNERFRDSDIFRIVFERVVGALGLAWLAARDLRWMPV
jgi:hypothetical protein